jgi:hypothetical protein
VAAAALAEWPEVLTVGGLIERTGMSEASIYYSVYIPVEMMIVGIAVWSLVMSLERILYIQRQLSILCFFNTIFKHFHLIRCLFQ